MSGVVRRPARARAETKSSPVMRLAAASVGRRCARRDEDEATQGGAAREQRGRCAQGATRHAGSEHPGIQVGTAECTERPAAPLEEGSTACQIRNQIFQFCCSAVCFPHFATINLQIMFGDL